MRATAVLATLVISASAVLAAPAGIQTNTNNVDHKLATVDSPKSFHQDCDIHNTQCKAINDVAYGTANQGEGSIGKQEGHATTAGANVLNTEGQSDLASHLATDGAILQHDLQGRSVPSLSAPSFPVPSGAAPSPSASPAPYNYDYSKYDKNMDDKTLASDGKSFRPDIKSRDESKAVEKEMKDRQATGKKDGQHLSKTLAADEKMVKSDLKGRDTMPKDVKAGETEGKKDGKHLSKTIKDDGKMVESDLKARGGRPDNHGHSEANQGMKNTNDQIFPSTLIANSGNLVDKQGKAVQAAGNGAGDMTQEANKEAQSLSNFNKDHGGETVNALVS